MTIRPSSVFSAIIRRIRQRLGLISLDRQSQPPQQQILDILESISDAFFSLDQQWRFTYVNSQATQVLNRSKADLIGKSIWEVFPEAEDSVFGQEYRRAVAERITVSLEAFYPPLNAWFTVRAYPIVSGLAVYFQDVTAQKSAEAAQLQQQQTAQRRRAEIEAIYATAPVGLCFNDTDLRYVRINQQLAEINGVPIQQHLGRTVREVLPELADQLEPIYRQVIETEKPILNLEVSGMNPAQPGVLRTWLSSFYPLKSEDDHVLGVNVVVQEITALKQRETERKQAEEALRQSEERYRSLFNSIDEGFAVIELLFDDADKAIDYRFLEVNPIFEQQAGLKNAVGKTIREFVPDLESHWFEIYGRVALTGEPVRFENGSESMNRWFDVYAFRVEEPEKRKVAILFRDVTDRRRTEKELRQKNAILDVINAAAPTPIFVKDRAGRIIYANPATLETLGKTADQVIGYRDAEISSPPELGAIVSENDQRIMTTGQTEVVEESPDGIRTFLGTKTPYRNETGEVIGLIGISNDITERVQFERERERLFQQEQAAREAAEQANRLKDEFLAVLSHELRTPLNPILGWIRLLQNGRLDPARTAEALNTIERNAKLQTQLIDDLLDISRIMRGKLSLNRYPVNVASVIQAAAETIRLTAEAKQITFDLQSDRQDYFVFGDAGRLQQVFWNLLSNAVKFTPEAGRVTIHLAQVEHQAQVQITDTGIGIRPDFLPHLFEHFRQEDGSITRKFGGLGLGLAIARQIMELHSGTISAESQGENQGATFIVRLPLLPQVPEEAVASTPVTPPTVDVPLGGIRAVIVDDNADTREFLTFLLETNGATVITVDSALEALILVKQAPPDILLSDIGMPEMTGYEFIRAVRAAKIAIPAIALTAYAKEFDRQQALESGFQQHLAKPIQPEALVAAVLELVQQSTARDSQS
ncbi:PAS domain-containing protein [Leptolyngbya sp. FACHB-17]|uniref:PAS domain-containing hybrid sensor histidine kinase/response regulator n=1 Tax=unclassified Leptolyngbya TaxID=2650499 RepID=UPI00168140C7|nr:PAS domain-containing protein [Leptolyngbya sp. FACHB-17]MBD2078578.1 PAS domain-containing protein [Leptolyngbya sp. FACHB-17]